MLKYVKIILKSFLINLTCQIKTRYQIYEILKVGGVNSVGYRFRDGTSITVLRSST
jgi:hypothetical protein